MAQIIKAQTETDIQVVADLAKAIWTEHFTPIIGIAQVKYMLDKFQSFPAMMQQIKDGYEYYTMFEHKKPVGYLCIAVRDASLFLSKIYVAKSMRGKGLGKQGIAFVEDLARSKNLESITLTVNKYNTNTIEAYKKMNFKTIDDVVMDIGGGFVMDDYIMKKKLAE